MKRQRSSHPQRGDPLLEAARRLLVRAVPSAMRALIATSAPLPSSSKITTVRTDGHSGRTERTRVNRPACLPVGSVVVDEEQHRAGVLEDVAAPRPACSRRRSGTVIARVARDRQVHHAPGQGAVGEDRHPVTGLDAPRDQRRREVAARRRELSAQVHVGPLAELLVGGRVLLGRARGALLEEVRAASLRSAQCSRPDSRLSFCALLVHLRRDLLGDGLDPRFLGRVVRNVALLHACQLGPCAGDVTVSPAASRRARPSRAGCPGRAPAPCDSQSWQTSRGSRLGQGSSK